MSYRTSRDRPCATQTLMLHHAHSGRVGVAAVELGMRSFVHEMCLHIDSILIVSCFSTGRRDWILSAMSPYVGKYPPGCFRRALRTKKHKGLSQTLLPPHHVHSGRVRGHNCRAGYRFACACSVFKLVPHCQLNNCFEMATPLGGVAY